MSVLVIAIIEVVANTLFGQNYNIVPNDTINAIAPFNDIYHFNIQQNNLTGDYLIFHWQQLELTVPDEWEANLCDNGNCFIGFPESGTMDTVYNGDYGLMSVGINPGVIEDTAFIQYVIWEENTPDQKDTLTWIIASGNTTDIAELQDGNSILASPNPANEQITISINWDDTNEFFITDMNGKKVFTGNSKGRFTIIPVANLAEGFYIVSLIGSNQVIRSQQIIINH